MLPAQDKHGIIISKIPVMQSGLKAITGEYLPDYDFSYCRSQEDLTLLQLRRTRVVVADLSGEIMQLREVCEHYCSLMARYRDIHWVYLIGRSCDTQAREFLACPESTLISESEPVACVGAAIRAGEAPGASVSQAVFVPQAESGGRVQETVSVLTLSERKVLRLLAKGWGINQIASLLKKSNKTVSAQKNSALRRLSLRSNAEMYAWMNSAQGMKELSIYSAYGEQREWEKRAPHDILLL